jgi:hypothetical protein
LVSSNCDSEVIKHPSLGELLERFGTTSGAGGG